MKNAKFFLLSLLIPALLLVSCNKDDNKPQESTYKQPTTRSEIVTVPAGLQTKAQANDNGATMAISYIGLANAFSSMGTAFIVPDGAQVTGKKSGSKVYSWSQGGYSYWITYTELADKKTWKYEWEQPGISRFTYITAEEANDGKSGNWKIYNPEVTTEDLWVYNWEISSTNTFTANLIWNAGSTSQSSFNVVSNANNSGTFKYYVDSVLNADIVWNSDGSGSYTFYGGLESYSGSWTAK